MSWTLIIGGNEHSMAELHASEAKLSKISLAPDEFKFASPSDKFANAGDSAELFHEGVRRFSGKLFKKKSVHTPGGEKFEYLFRGPWQNLREIQYTQEWGEKNFETDAIEKKRKAQVLLGYDYDGEKIGILEQAEKIIEWAKGEGLDFDIDFDFDNFDIPADEMTDLNCEEALMRCLKWAPDLVGSFDYSGKGAPVLKISRRNKLPELVLDDGVDFKRISHCERDDMRVESVCIIYENENYYDGESWVKTQREVYPPDAKVGGSKSVIHTIKLGGLSGNTQRCKVETANINVDSADWWREKFPSLAVEGITRIEVSNVLRETTLPRELVSGSVFDWMMKTAKPDKISADITCYAGNQKISSKKCIYKCVATEASTYIYSRAVVRGEEEAVPWGLAKAIYDSSSQSLMEGDAVIAGAETLELLGKRISVPDKFDGAVPVSTSLDIFSKTLTVKYGPPKHLYPSDISRLFRLARTRNTPSSTSRGSGISARSGTTEVGGIGSFQNSVSDMTNITQLEISDEDAFDSKVSINLYDIDEKDEKRALNIKLRRTLVIKDGKAQQAYVLMSEPFPM